ncbi:hypothetical protein ACFRAQ_27310 [Nocardia sp. NPDC056611]|uniref:hypothetical protein n=1 Tax=Nocardia sp. NPDC056611 TaxID=3345877 RepID=UPI0036718553
MSGWLRRRIAVAPLVAVAPGGTETRLAIERVLRENGWRQAESPAAADLLVVAGTGGDEFEAAVRRIHEAMPLPRLRIDVTDPTAAAAALAAAATDLRSRRAASPGEHAGHSLKMGGHGEHRGDEPPGDMPDHSAHAGNDEHASHPPHSTQDMTDAHAGHSTAMGEADDHDAHGGHTDHGGHGAHGGHGGGMPLPGGLVMADREADRDGLALDALTVSLGPVLVDWPGGLVVRARLQGDVVSGVAVSVPGAGHGGEPYWLGPWLRAERGEAVGERELRRWRAARALDVVATLLEVAGWEDAAAAGRRFRDDVLAGVGSPGAQQHGDGPGAMDHSPELLDSNLFAVDAGLDRWARRVARSRVLRWSLRDAGRVDGGEGAPPGLVGDTHDRLLAWVAEAVGGGRVADFTSEAGEFVALERARNRWIVEHLPRLLTGAELGEARLIVAGLGVDVEVAVWDAAGAGVAHG